MNRFLTSAAPTLATSVKCLIVDDKEENLIALEALLRQDDVTVLKAQSGAQALELLLLHHDIALALLDVQMPEMNGFELAEMIRGRERTRHIPLIFVTAGTRNADWQFQGYESGAVDFLYKPVQPYELLSKASVFFTLHRQRLALTHELECRTESLRINEMFMAVLGHDLRTPLTSVLTNAGALARLPGDERAQLMASRIANSARRMGSMIDDLLDVTRIRQSGGLQLQLAPTSLDSVSTRVIDEAHGLYPERTVAVLSAGNVQGHWDSDRLAQVVSNLLGNAMRHGSTDRPISVELDGASAESVRFSISNGGCIPPELLPELFQPFRSTSSTGARQDGLGLGLFIVQQIVLSHGGTISVESANGQTAFHVTLPRTSILIERAGTAATHP